MQNTPPGQPGIFYTIDKPEHKFYFGHYLNTARHNVYKIFNHLLAKYNQPAVSEEKLADCILLQQQQFAAFTNANDLFMQLTLHLPVLEYLKENNNEAAVFGTLQKLLKDLNSFRNYFTHHYYDKKLVFNNFRETKKFNKSMPYLFGSAVSAARKKTKLPYEAFNDVFKWQADRNSPNLLVPSWQQTMLLEDGTPTTFGITFFTCLFLETKDINLFISRIRGLKSTAEDKFKATREAYSAFAITLPKPPKLESSDIKLDIINELFRVPNTVYKKLPEAYQQQFNIINTETGQEVKMKRHKNRFDYFALRSFEDNGLLPGISFHIKMGEAYLAGYDKTVPGSSVITKRLVTKQLNAFGPLQYFHNYTNLANAGYNTSQLAERQLLNINGMDVKYMPQYNITDNKIGFKLTNKDVTVPHVSLRDKKIRQVQPYHFINLAPDAILSTYELPNLYLYNHLHQQGFIQQPANTFLKNVIEQCAALAQSLKNKDVAGAAGNPLYKKGNLPAKLNQHIQGGYNVQEAIKQKLKGLLYETNNIIDEIKEQGKLEKGKGKRGYTAGSVATWIAKDILFFMRPDEQQQKLSDFEYNTLQSYIAFFGSNKSAIDIFLKQFKIAGCGNENRHPFLNPVTELANNFTAKIKEMQSRGYGPKRKFDNAVYSLVRFFTDYLFERRRYIETLLNNLNAQTIESIGYFTKIKPGVAVQLDYREPVMLPRHIFNAAITAGLEKMFAAANKLFERGDVKKASPSWLIKQWHPGLQEFYSMPRQYNKYRLGNDGYELEEEIFIDKEHDLKQCQQKLKTYNDQESHELLNRIDDTEQETRLEQYRDRVLFMMLQDYFNRQQQHQQINISGKTLADFSKGFKNDSVKTILDIEIDMSLTLHGVAVKAKLPVKRYGEFRKIFKDRRMANLLGYFDKEADWQEVLNELEYYNSNRERVLQACISFEEKLCNKYSVEVKALARDNYISHTALLGFCNQNVEAFPAKYIRGDGYILLTETRNRFLHNEVLEKGLFEIIFPGYTFTKEGITKQITEKVIELYNQLKDKI
jgi:hypothetical protein